MASHIVGYPRMGPKRELKFALESFWDGKSSADDLQKVAADIRSSIWKQMSGAGIKYIPSNTFSYYDQVLDTTAMLGAVPKRYGWKGGEIGFDTYFSMARGNATLPAMEMTKWFDTNYHFIVPELGPDTKFTYSSHKAVTEYKEAKALGVDTVPVLIGPVSYLLLSKPEKGVDKSFSTLSLLEQTLHVYKEVVAELKAAGASWIQFDEPTLVLDLDTDKLQAFTKAYSELESAFSGLNVLVVSYFADVPAEAYKTLTGLNCISGFGFDLVRGTKTLDLIKSVGFPAGKYLFAGVVDGRNIWANDLASSLGVLHALEDVVGKDKLVVSTSCSLMHTAVDLINETKLDDEIKSWLAFAAQKVVEVNALAKALAGQKDEAFFSANASALASRKSSPRVTNEEVQKDAAALKGSDHRRATNVTARLDAQQQKLNLPILPTTTIGSFPQTIELRRVRREYKGNKISEEEYVKAIKEEEEEDNETQNLKFYGEMDPLDFALKDSSNGEEIYRQFERLEYEAIAERKRKALLDPQNRDEQAKKLREEEGAAMEVINEFMNFRRRRRRSKEPKKKGRKRGSKNNINPEVARKLGDATLHYASENYDEAICLLEEIVRLAPCSPDAYHILGLIYDAKGDRKKALNFHMIAAHLTPKDSSLWRKLVAWSLEQNNTGQVRYCLSKAITADPKDVGLRFDLASLYLELGEYPKAAGLYNQIVGLYPSNVVARKMAAKMYQKCGQLDKAIGILEDFVNVHYSQADRSFVDLLITLQMENKDYTRALHHISQACLTYGPGNKVPLYLKAKEVVCHAHLGNPEHAEVLLKKMQMEQAEHKCDMIAEIGDTFMNLGHYGYALKFYFMLEQTPVQNNGSLHVKIAKCYVCMKERGKAILFFYKALSAAEDNIDDRITLSSLLLEEDKEDEAIKLLSTPKSSGPLSNDDSSNPNPWWLNGKVRMQLAKIYLAKGMLEDFANAIRSVIHKSLVIEAMNRKVRNRACTRRRLPKSVLSERAKILEDQQVDSVFHKLKPLAKESDLVKAFRAKKSLAKMAALREEEKAAALAAGMDWQSEDSEDEAPLEQSIEEPPLRGLLLDEENHQLILDLCKALLSLRRYMESLEIVNLTLKLADTASCTISSQKKEELRSLGAQIAYNTRDPKHGYNYARYIVQHHPRSVGAWNCYYKVVSRLESRLTKHGKFLLRAKDGNCVYPLIISGNQFTAISQHQAAARDYLEAYKLEPQNPFISLCVGTALINLALGFRLQSKHRCIVQAFSFLYNYLRLCNNSQEALYNVARAYHHVGLVSLAASYYERVLCIHEKDYPIPKLPNEEASIPKDERPGYCNLHREAAYNLHLIYKKSGAVDLARQVLKNHCTL